MESILKKDEKQKIYLVSQNNENIYKNLFKNYFPDLHNQIFFINNMPPFNCSEKLPKELLESDSIFYDLNLPLSAKNLLWIQKIPQDISIWLTIPISKKGNFCTRNIFSLTKG